MRLRLTEPIIDDDSLIFCGIEFQTVDAEIRSRNVQAITPPSAALRLTMTTVNHTDNATAVVMVTLLIRLSDAGCVSCSCVQGGSMLMFCSVKVKVRRLRHIRELLLVSKYLSLIHI